LVDFEKDIIGEVLAPGSQIKKTKTKDQKKKETQKKKIPIKKYSQNGLGRLHESVIIDTTSKFVHLDKDQKPHFVNEIERANDILIPGDTIDTQTLCRLSLNLKMISNNI
jgi:hypothetical protein